jgi:phage-related protein
MANGVTYSAGQARITLKPKLADDFQEKTKTLLETINPTIKVTAKPVLEAGFRTTLRDLVKTASTGIFATVGVKVDTTGLRERIRLSTVGAPAAKIDVKVDLAHATEQMQTFRTEQAAIPLTLNANVDTAAAVAQLLALRALAGSVGDQVNGIGARGIASSATRLTGNIITRPIRAIRLQVEIDKASVAKAEAEVAQIASRLSTARDRQTSALDKLNLAEQRHREVMARSNTSLSQQMASTQALTRARREFAAASGRVTDLMGREAEADTRLDRARRDRNSFSNRIEAAYSAFSSALGDAAQNAFKLSNVLGVAKVALIGLAAVSLVPLLGQLAQAAGVVGLLPGMFAAVVGAAAALRVGFEGIGDAFSAGVKAQENAAKDAEAHAKAVASAQKAQVTAARSVVDAERGISTAERGVKTAQKETLDAQKALTRARRDAKTEIDDLNRALGRTALNEESAAIAVAEAQKELYKVFMDPNSDAIERARAQNSVKQALADQQDTIRKTQELQEQANEANAKGVEGSDQVVSAKERVESAAQGEIDAQQSLADANLRLTDAQQALTEANQALTEEMNKSSDSAEAFATALGKLSPNARDFVKKMLALKPALSDLREAVQESLFDKMGDSVTRLANNWLPTLTQGLRGLTIEINGGLRRAFADLDTDATRSKVSKVFDNIKASIGPVIDGIENLVQGILSLTGVSSEFLPGMGNGFLELTERFRKWAESPEGQQKFRDFLNDSIATFRNFMKLGRNVVDIIKEIFRGSDETGTSWLETLVENSKKLADYLGTPEGQQKIKDFFKEVEKIVKGISTAVTDITKLLDRIGAFKFKDTPLGNVAGAFDENKSGTERAKSLDKGVGQIILKPAELGFDGVKAAARAQANIADSIMQDLRDKARDMAKDVTSFWYQMGTGAFNLGQSIVDNIGEKASRGFDRLKDKLPGLLDSFSNFGSSAKDSFGSFKDFLVEQVEFITGASLFGKLHVGLSDLKDFFGTIVNGISGIWSGLVGAIQGPINLVIDTLNAFGTVWNAVADKLGLPKWDPVARVGGGAPVAPAPQTGPEGPARTARADGGPIFGPGGPRDDKIPAWLSNGEHVWTAREVEAAGGHNAMYRMRQNVLAGGGKQSNLDGPLGRFASGGTVSTSDPMDPIQTQLWDLVRSAIPSAILTSGKRFTEAGSGFDYHMQGKAIDLGGPMDDIARWIYNAYPQSTELIHWPLNGWENLKNGAPLNYGEPTNSQHRDHVHWASKDFLGELSEDQKKSFMDRVRAGLGSVVNTGRSFAIDNLLGRPLRAIADSVPDIPGLGQFGQTPKAFARKMADAAIKQVTDMLGGGTGSSSGSGGVNYDPSGGGEQWRALAQEAMRRTGFNADDPRQVNAMLAQINSESGGNPSILQQVHDVNSGGNEAQGLLQVIPGTFAAYRDPSLPNDRADPLANMVAALNYYKNRYGSDLTTTWGHGHGYDEGGIFPHKTIGWNLSGLPEAVLTNPQWRMFQQFIEQMPGFNSQLQAIPQPGNGGTNSDGTPGTFGVPTNPGVDTLEQVGNKARDRYTSAFQTGLIDFFSANLGPLGLPDPRDIPVVKAATEYGQTLDTWQKARQASAEASQALANSGYQAAGVSPVGTADVVTGNTSDGQQTVNDNSTTINIYPADVDEAFRKAQQIAELRSLTARGR